MLVVGLDGVEIVIVAPMSLLYGFPPARLWWDPRKGGPAPSMVRDLRVTLDVMFVVVVVGIKTVMFVVVVAGIETVMFVVVVAGIEIVVVVVDVSG